MKLDGKLLFSSFAPKFSVIARPVRTLVVAIPQLEGKRTETHQKLELPRILVVIVTWFHSTGGLPRPLKRTGLAMTALIL